MLGRKHLIAVSCLICLGWQGRSADADEAGSASSAEKVPVMKELLEASRVTRNAQLGFNLVFEQEVKGLNAALAARIDQDSKLGAEEKEKAKTELLGKLDKRMERFKTLSNEKVKLGEIVSDVYTKLYDKYFSLEELKDMLAFYKSPTGQKSLDVLPQLTNEAVQMINQAASPRLREVSAQIDQEDKAAK
jgi:hypothetical protein